MFVADRYALSGRLMWAQINQTITECNAQCSCACNTTSSAAASSPSSAASANGADSSGGDSGAGAASGGSGGAASANSSACKNRVVQRAPIAPGIELEIFKTEHVGWGVRSLYAHCAVLFDPPTHTINCHCSFTRLLFGGCCGGCALRALQFAHSKAGVCVRVFGRTDQ